MSFSGPQDFVQRLPPGVVHRGCFVFWFLLRLLESQRIWVLLLGFTRTPILFLLYIQSSCWSSVSLDFIPWESFGNVGKHSWLLHSGRGNFYYLIGRDQDVTKHPTMSKVIPHSKKKKNIHVSNTYHSNVDEQWFTITIPYANRLS